MITLAAQEEKLRITQNPSRSMVNTWYKKLIEEDEIIVYVANNEQLPFSETELDFPMRQMLTKKETGYDQTGDYVITVKDHVLRFVVERKSINDLYGTLFSKSSAGLNRERFYREIDRFHRDDRFDTFIVLVEGSYKDFLLYAPTPNFNKNKEYWGKVEKMKNAKKSSINSLNIRPGVKVIFNDSRAQMCETFNDFVRQYCLQNWETLIKEDN